MRQLLPFCIGAEKYALELFDVQEIVENVVIYPFPGAPEVVAGAIGFHGRIVPVVNLARLLGDRESPLGQRLIVLTNGQGPVALGVSKVLPVLKLEATREQLPDGDAENPFVSCYLYWENDMITVFNLQTLRSQLELLCGSTGV